MPDDVYTAEQQTKEHSLRFINIKVRNVVGILNRIASLMRRKRYNMEEVSVSFANDHTAYILVAVDGRLVDVTQVMHQIEKLHDVLSAQDVTDQQDKLSNALYVDAENESALENLPQKPLRVVPAKNGVKGIFMISLKDTAPFISALTNKKLRFVRRVISLL